MIARGIPVAIGLTVIATACGGGGGTAQAGCANLNSVGYNAPLAAPVARAAAPSLPVAAATGASLPVTMTGTVVKIGFQGMLAGKYQQYGVDEKDGVQMAIDEANAAGITVGGTSYTLQLVAQDDNADPTLAVTAAQSLIDSGVVAVVGGVFSGATIAASTKYQAAGITQISPSATNPKYTDQGYNNTFRVVGRDDQQGPADADFLIKTLGCKNVAVIDDKSQYGQGLADAVNTQVGTDGGTVVDREHVDPNGSDFSAQLTTVKGKNPDVIFYGGYSPQAGPLASQAKKLGLTVPLLGGDGVQDDQFITLAGDAATGNFASNAGPAHNLMNGYDAFAAKFKTKFGVDVFQYAPQAYDAANIIINAIKKDGADKAKILADVAATSGYQGISQTITFNKKGDIQGAIFTIYKVESGKWVGIKAITAS
ncbi:MAG: branched-chain amino acid ABC transporter substrate-binding protein [Candidatus Dormibacteria bacterium]